MAINKKLIHFKNKENFENEVANENILDKSIVFIQDSKEISTHGTVYKSINWNVLDSKYNFIDLGLPSKTLWADRNIGASSLGNSGLYFAWGEIEGYSRDSFTRQFNWGSYKFCNGTEKTLTKYNFNESYGIVDNLVELEEEDDAAFNDESILRIPTWSQIQELISNTTIQYVSNFEDSGVNGLKFISKINSNFIFIPSSGGIANGEVSGYNQYGYLLGRTLKSDNPRNILDYYWDTRLGQGNMPRAFGIPYRPILKIN